MNKLLKKEENKFDLSDKDKPIRFGFYYPLGCTNTELDEYNLLIESVKIADDEDASFFWSVDFGLNKSSTSSSNPSVINSALSMITKQIEIRGESTIASGQDSLRIVEEWSIIDNTSNGRAGLSFRGSKISKVVDSLNNINSIQKKIEDVRQLWSGNGIRRVNGAGTEVELRTFPRPIQKELPIWVAVAEDEIDYTVAGSVGANLLIYHFGTELDDLEIKINSYKKALKTSGYTKWDITIVIPTYIVEKEHTLNSISEESLVNYLTMVKNFKQVASSSFYAQEGKAVSHNEDVHAILKTYHQFNSLIGTKESCLQVLKKLKTIGIDEVAHITSPNSIKHQMFKNLKNTDLN